VTAQPIKEADINPAADVEMFGKCRAFKGEPVRTHALLISGDVVRVWDDVAKHFTTCHSICASAQRRSIDEAREQRGLPRKEPLKAPPLASTAYLPRSNFR
jgi:hypothetical protein